jgi:FMN-dependent NADH-azoreductase
MTQDKINKVLAGIHSRIPKGLMSNVVREFKATPHLEELIELAINDKDFPEFKKEALKVARDAGDFSKKKIREEPRIAKMIDEFVSREIKKEIKKGNLPKKFNVELHK